MKKAELIFWINVLYKHAYQGYINNKEHLNRKPTSSFAEGQLWAYRCQLFDLEMVFRKLLDSERYMTDVIFEVGP